jgi:hypothetical protein
MVSVFELSPIHAPYCFPTDHVYTAEVQNGVVPQGLTRLSCVASTTPASCQATAWAQNTAISTSSGHRELRTSPLQHAGPQQSPAEILPHSFGDLGQSEPPRMSETRERTLHYSTRSCMSYQPHQHQRRDRDCTMQYFYPLCLPQSAQKLATALPRNTNPSISRTSSAH